MYRQLINVMEFTPFPAKQIHKVTGPSGYTLFFSLNNRQRVLYKLYQGEQLVEEGRSDIFTNLTPNTKIRRFKVNDATKTAIDVEIPWKILPQ